jgi:hypothetical protein
VLGENADQGVDDRLGHGEAGQLRVGADIRSVALGNHLAVAHHHDRPGAPERRLGRLFKRVIERGLQRRIAWLDHGRPGDVRQ